LKKSGHKVTAYYRSNTAKRAIPEWSLLTDGDVTSQVIIPESDRYQDWISDQDIIVLGWMRQADEFSDSKIPAVLWEQGSELIYGDYSKLAYSGFPERLNIHRLYRIPVHLLAVSTTVQTVLKGVFNRDAQLFPNGIDTGFYYPLEHKNNEIPIVLLVGNPYLKFKGFDFAKRALDIVSQSGVAFKVWWASPMDFPITGTSLRIEKFVNPTQERLAELYRNADVFLSTSLYESFSLPPMEAMASGAAVVSTDNGGIRTYAEPGHNCLLCDQGDLDSTVYALIHLLINPAARMALAKAGRETALKYTFSNIVPQLERCFGRILAQYD